MAADLVPVADANIITDVTGFGSFCSYAAVAAAMAAAEVSAKAHALPLSGGGVFLFFLLFIFFRFF